MTLDLGQFPEQTHMRFRMYPLLLIVLGSLTLACDRTGTPPESGAARVVDSILPREEVLRRFQRNLSPVARLESSYGSRDSLLAAFVEALGDRDTAALATMAVSRTEFAYLYYPSTPQSLPPYDLDPGLMWDLLHQRSERGIQRALAAYGGQPLRLLGHDCGKESSREGENTIAGPCNLRLRDQRGKPVSVRLLSQIMERGGRFKVLNYANKL